MSHAVEEKIASSSETAGVPLPRSIRRHHSHRSDKQRFWQRKHKPPPHCPALQRVAPLSRVPQPPRTSDNCRRSLAIISFAAAKRWPSKQSFSANRSVIESMERRLCLGRACRSRQIHDGRGPRLCKLQLLFCRGRCRTRQVDTSEQVHEAVKSFRKNTRESVGSVTSFTL